MRRDIASRPPWFYKTKTYKWHLTCCADISFNHTVRSDRTLSVLHHLSIHRFISPSKAVADYRTEHLGPTHQPAAAAAAAVAVCAATAAQQHCERVLTAPQDRCLQHYSNPEVSNNLFSP